MKRFKVINNNDFLVGLRFSNTGTEKLIQKRAFIYLNDEEIQEINSVSKLFQKGVIYVEDEEANKSLGYTEKNPNTISEPEVKAILELGNAKMKQELSKITEDHAIKKVMNVISDGKVDLPQSKIKIISDTLKIDVNELIVDAETI